MTRDYVEALEARGVPHLLVGGKTFHEREEVDAVRTALTAIEWPEDELSVYATIHGPLFAVGEEELLEYHAVAGAFHPYRVPRDLPGRLAPVGRALRRCGNCMRRATIARWPTRSAACSTRRARMPASSSGAAASRCWPTCCTSGDLSRRYEAEGGLSFRGFVDLLREAAGNAEAPEARSSKKAAKVSG